MSVPSCSSPIQTVNPNYGLEVALSAHDDPIMKQHQYSVCVIRSKVDSRLRGAGFLIAENVIMTCSHFISDPSSAAMYYGQFFQLIKCVFFEFYTHIFVVFWRPIREMNKKEKIYG